MVAVYKKDQQMLVLFFFLFSMKNVSCISDSELVVDYVPIINVVRHLVMCPAAPGRICEHGKVKCSMPHTEGCKILI